MFQEILAECYAIEYEKDPNYAMLIFTLKKVLLKREIVPGGKYFLGKPD